MTKPIWLEHHVLLLGKINANLTTIELAARLVIENHQRKDLKAVMHQLATVKEGEMVDVTPMTDPRGMKWALKEYNKCVESAHPELQLDVEKLVFLRDALAHGKVFGVNDPKAGRYLRLLKFDKEPVNGKVEATLRVEMTREWFDKTAEELVAVDEKIRKALDWEKADLGALTDPDAQPQTPATNEDLGLKKLTPETWLKPDPTFLKTAPITVELFFNLALTQNGRDIDLPEVFVPVDGWLQAIHKPQLHAGVPKDIRKLFEAAKGMFAYGYCFYPLCTLASEQLFRILECAVSAACLGKPGAPKKKASFEDKIEWLIQTGVINQDERKSLHSIRTLRNSTSHPSHQMLVVPQLVGQFFVDLATTINGLFKWDQNKAASA